MVVEVNVMGVPAEVKLGFQIDALCPAPDWLVCKIPPFDWPREPLS